MTNIPANWRVGVDWDSNGAIMWHSRKDFPANLVKSAPWMGDQAPTVFGGGGEVDKVVSDYYPEQSADTHDKYTTGTPIYRVQLFAVSEAFFFGRRAGDFDTWTIINGATFPGFSSSLYLAFWVYSPVSTTMTLRFSFSLDGNGADDASSAVNVSLVTGWNYVVKTFVQPGVAFYSHVAFSASMANTGTYRFSEIYIFKDFTTNMSSYPETAGVNNAFTSSLVYKANAAGFEDVTRYVLSLDMQSGTTDPTDQSYRNPTASLVLDNSSGDWFPAEVNPSPGRNLLSAGKLVVIEAEFGDGYYKRVWTGYLRRIRLTKQTNNSTLELDCEYTMFQDGDKASLPTKYERAIASVYEIAQAVLLRNGGQPAYANKSGFRLGYSRLGTNSFLSDYDLFAQTAGDVAEYTAPRFLTYFGLFQEDLSVAEVMAGLLHPTEIILGVDRFGRFSLNDTGWSVVSPDYSIDVDNRAIEVAYNIGENTYNSVTIRIKPMYNGNVDVLPEAAVENNDDSDDDDKNGDIYWGMKKNIPVGGMKRFKKKIKHLAIYEFDGSATDHVNKWGLAVIPDYAQLVDWDATKMEIAEFRPAVNTIPSAATPDSRSNSIIFERATPASADTNYVTDFSSLGEYGGGKAAFRVNANGKARLRFANDGSGKTDQWTVNLVALRCRARIRLPEQTITSSVLANEQYNDTTLELPDALFNSAADAQTYADILADNYSEGRPFVEKAVFIVENRNDPLLQTLVNGGLVPGALWAVTAKDLRLTDAKHTLIGYQLNLELTKITVTLYFYSHKGMQPTWL